VSASETSSLLQLLGAGGFGVLLGWLVYYTNRYRRGEVQLSDLVTLVGIIGGGAVLALFPAKTDLFGAYGIGLFVGFFGYFLMLVLMVLRSPNFTIEWFLDGRRIPPAAPYEIPPEMTRETRPPMEGPQGRRSIET
jgi:hypothetical protein